MQLVDTLYTPLLHVCDTVYLRCRDFLPKSFSIEKLRLQEAQY